MVTRAVARESVFALRRKIAKIEGRLPDLLEVPSDSATDAVVVRRGGIPATEAGFLPTGAISLDAALGGGVPKAALTEIHGIETRNAGAVSGFVLALVGLLLSQLAQRTPVLWIGTAEIFREAGLPYAIGLGAHFGIAPHELLVSQTSKLADALWVAEEAARVKALSAVLLEVRGNASALDLTATRRLHRRAQEAGRPVFLLRHGARTGPTAAPLRLVVWPTPAGPRRLMNGVLAGSIGPPGFGVAIGKSRAAPPGQFELEWNPDEHAFQERGGSDRSCAKNPVPLVSLFQHRTHHAAASGAVLAFRSADASGAAGHQPAGEEYGPDRGSRRSG